MGRRPAFAGKWASTKYRHSFSNLKPAYHFGPPVGLKPGEQPAEIGKVVDESAGEINLSARRYGTKKCLVREWDMDWERILRLETFTVLAWVYLIIVIGLNLIL